MCTTAREYIRLRKIVLLLLCVSCLYSSAFVSSSAPQNQLVMLGNIHAPDSLQAEELKQIFLGKKTRWQDDRHIGFALFTETESYKKFLKEYVGKTPAQYKNYWKKQVFSGKGRMPKSFKDPQKLLEFLSVTDGAIAFVSQLDIESERIKVLRIE